MWMKSTLVVAVLYSTTALVSAWKFDESCGPVNLKGNVRGAIEYMMQWPDKVNNHLGNDKDVNAYSKQIFNEEDFDKAKSIINAVGKMSKEGSSDTLDPVIYCDEKRLKPIKDVKNPNKPVDTMKDTKNNIKIARDDCSEDGSKTLAYTINWSKGGEKHTYIQLCHSVLKKAGHVMDGDEKVEPAKLNSALNFMAKVGAPTHIDHFQTLHMTLFHEFVHTWKVKEPEIDDADGGYGWDGVTGLSRENSVDNADSFAYVAMGTWLIKHFGASISNKGVISVKEDELAKRGGLVGVSWFA